MVIQSDLYDFEVLLQNSTDCGIIYWQGQLLSGLLLSAHQQIILLPSGAVIYDLLMGREEE
jgi:hypothetical protein